MRDSHVEHRYNTVMLRKQCGRKEQVYMSNEGKSIRKERSMMTVFAVVILSALTIMGIYIRNRRSEVKLDDGYTIDFSALKERATQKMDEIATNPDQTDSPLVDARDLEKSEEVDGELDYMPMEAGSEYVQIKGLTEEKGNITKTIGNSAGDGAGKSTVNIPQSKESETLPNMIKKQTDVSGKTNDRSVHKQDAIEPMVQKEVESMAQKEVEPMAQDSEMLTVVSSSPDVMEEEDFGGLIPHFAPENGLTYPAQGDILMHYSMDKSIYFKTLDQYQYNPAVLFKVDEGKQVYACANGKVIDIHEDAKLGLTLTLDLGDGYLATYGQLHNLAVCENTYVDAGDALGFVNAPTRYYSLEGSNLYFKLTKDGEPVNPEGMFR